MFKILLLLFISANTHAFYGYKMKSYVASMDGHFKIKAQSEFEAQEKAPSLSKLHTSFMIGSLYGINGFGKRGTISKNYKTENIAVTALDSETFQVTYTVDVIMLLEDKKDLANFYVTLPTFPEQTFEKADTSCVQDYWYAGAQFVYYQFWSPLEKKCKMIPGRDYLDYPVTLAPRESTTESYPRYSEMVQDGEVSFYYYFGSDFESMTRFGEAGVGFEKLKYWLGRRKFNFVKDPNYRKTLSQFFRAERKVGGTKIIFKGMLGNPLPKTPTAHKEYFWFMKEAYESGSFIQYTGHAGHGGIMDLTKLSTRLEAPVNFPEDRYQIYYINGCQTYIYANDYYPGKKNGFKNLNLLVNGDVSWSQTTWEGMEVFLEHFVDHFTTGARMSYQDMIDESSEKMRKKLGTKYNTPMFAIEGDDSREQGREK